MAAIVPDPTVGFRAPTVVEDWTFRLSVDGQKGGDRFSVPYYVRVIVDRAASGCPSSVGRVGPAGPRRTGS